MGIIIQDPLNILSKMQRQKIKDRVRSYLKDGTNNTEISIYLKKEVLNNIHYSSDKKYNNIEYENTDTDIILTFSITETNHNKLKEKIRMKEYMRKNTNDPNADKWKSYYQLKSQLPIPLPDPDTIHKQRDMYVNMLPKMPKTKLKEYIEKCLE